MAQKVTESNSRDLHSQHSYGILREYYSSRYCYTPYIYSLLHTLLWL
nr:MAG TPA: hypothetical protein [Caudoviricetes sp.]